MARVTTIHHNAIFDLPYHCVETRKQRWLGIVANQVTVYYNKHVVEVYHRMDMETARRLVRHLNDAYRVGIVSERGQEIT